MPKIPKNPVMGVFQEWLKSKGYSSKIAESLYTFPFRPEPSKPIAQITDEKLSKLTNTEQGEVSAKRFLGVNIPRSIAGLLDMPSNIAQGVIEDPIKLGADLLKFIPKQAQNVALAVAPETALENMGFGLVQRDKGKKKARREIYEDPLSPVFALLMAKGGVKKAGSVGKGSKGTTKTIDNLYQESKITNISDAKIKEALKVSEDLRSSTFSDPKFVEGLASKPTELAGAAKVDAMYDRTIMEMKEPFKFKLRKWMDKGVRSFVDQGGNVKRNLIKEGGELGKKAVMEHDLAKGSSARASLLMEKFDNTIYKDLSKADRFELDKLIGSRRAVTISEYKPDFKHQEGLTASDFSQKINQLKAQDPLRFEKLNKRATEYFKAQQEQLDKLHSEGLITQETYDFLKTKDYSPRELLDRIDPDITGTHNGRPFNVPSSGLKRLEGGSEKLVNADTRALLQHTVTSTEARLAHNRANKALYDLAKETPENGVVEIMKGEKVPAGKDVISVMIDGQKQNMLLPRGMAKEWATTPPSY